METAALQVEKELVSSLDIAERFGKRHGQVMRDIREMAKTHQIKIIETSSKRVNNLGFSVKSPYILIDHALNEMIVNRYNGIKLQLSSREKVALDTIEQLLNVKLKRQYKVLNYRIDGYDDVNNIAYEIDEGHHANQVVDDMIRQRRIENELGCKFVRIKV
ncbi:TPA: Rha family transcriptional regulator [Escherichia coli]|uniref:Rha family transcriptional regulator n=1 Tax=Escherichia coli TaxID=562 RepID=UPI000BE83418|nr:Rha family transcriptional regulator [Escherichia coli]EGO4170445.1 hypothetical protein [Escherichia coli]EKJ4556577.1 Rha family transcriptional regulator [Escherichia coli]EMC2697967.1 Rha family transcriptional regulator [Escherichia coli]MBC0109621.1 Rha family transcriptional regulator [Escherichia coli]